MPPTPAPEKAMPIASPRLRTNQAGRNIEWTMKLIAIDEMRHADTLAERNLFLDGLPNFQALGKLRIGESIEEVLKCDLDLEHEAIPLLKEAIAHCEHVRDYVSREIFERILESEEEHVDFLETQFDMIERMGLQNYIQLNSKAAEAE